MLSIGYHDVILSEISGGGLIWKLKSGRLIMNRPSVLLKAEYCFKSGCLDICLNWLSLHNHVIFYLTEGNHSWVLAEVSDTTSSTPTMHRERWEKKKSSLQQHPQVY